jgi:hypothetical protein
MRLGRSRTVRSRTAPFVRERTTPVWWLAGRSWPWSPSLAVVVPGAPATPTAADNQVQSAHRAGPHPGGSWTPRNNHGRPETAQVAERGPGGRTLAQSAMSPQLAAQQEPHPPSGPRPAETAPVRQPAAAAASRPSRATSASAEAECAGARQPRRPGDRRLRLLRPTPKPRNPLAWVTMGGRTPRCHPCVRPYRKHTDPSFGPRATRPRFAPPWRPGPGRPGDPARGRAPERVPAAANDRLAWATGFTGSAGAAVISRTRPRSSSTAATPCRSATRWTRAVRDPRPGRGRRAGLSGDARAPGQASATTRACTAPTPGPLKAAARQGRRRAEPVPANPLDEAWGARARPAGRAGGAPPAGVSRARSRPPSAPASARPGRAAPTPRC